MKNGTISKWYHIHFSAYLLKFMECFHETRNCKDAVCTKFSMSVRPSVRLLSVSEKLYNTETAWKIGYIFQTDRWTLLRSER